MTRDEIIKMAEACRPESFMGELDEQRIDYMILDQDNISDPNDGYFNITVAGLEPGEALLFVDGEFSGL